MLLDSDPLWEDVTRMNIPLCKHSLHNGKGWIEGVRKGRRKEREEKGKEEGREGQRENLELSMVQ